MTPDPQHLLLWDDRLQDWLDGDVDSPASDPFRVHLAGCEICRQRLSEFQQLDEALRRSSPPLAMDESFDRRLLAQIDTIDAAQRAAARQRVDQELRENRYALSRSWRRMLALVAPGVIAGIAVAFALAGFVSTEVAHQLAQDAGSLAGNSGRINLALTTLFSAAIGAGAARWLTSVAE